jgi:allatostatin A receptor
MDEYPVLNFTETTEDDSLEAIVSIVVPILFSFIGIIGFIGNILVIITVLFNQQMRNTTNLLILNLSLADLLFVCFCIPATVSLMPFNI